MTSEATEKLTPHRNDFIILANVRHIEKAIEAETVQLNCDNRKSVFLWADRLHASDSLLGFKSQVCSVPLGSNLANDAFVLMIQTPSQQELFHRYGNNGIIFIDSMHNTTMYQNMILMNILVRDYWGHGTSASYLQVNAALIYWL